jgi:hypothetical protein
MHAKFQEHPNLSGWQTSFPTVQISGRAKQQDIEDRKEILVEDRWIAKKYVN